MAEYYIPAAMVMVGEKPVVLEQDSVLACIYYYLVAKHRDSLMVGSRKRLRAVSILYYPFNIIDIHGKYAAVIDTIVKPIYTIAFDKPLLEDLLERFNVLGDLRGQEFTEEISNIKNLLEAMYAEKEGVVSKRYEVKGLVYNKNLLQELRVLASIASPKGLPGIVVPEKNIDVNEAKQMLEEMLDNTSMVVDQLTSMINSLDQHYDKWRKRVELEHEAKKEELGKEAEVIKLVIQKKIEEYEARLEVERKRIDEKYSAEERELLDKIRSLEEKISDLRRRVEEGIARREYGIELKRLVREKKRLERRLEGLRRLKNRQKRVVEKKIRSLISAETIRQRLLEKELERFGRELSEIVSKTSREVESLKKAINRIIEHVMEVRKNITSILIEPPSLGAGKYFVPFIALLYRSIEGTDLLNIVPLIKMRVFRAKTLLTRKPRLEEVQVLASRAMRLKSIINTSDYRKTMLTVNLLDEKYLDMASRGFEKLVKEDIIGSGEAYEVLSLIESAIESHA